MLTDGVIVHWPFTEPALVLAPNGHRCYSVEVLATIGDEYSRYEMVFDSEEKAWFLIHRFYQSIKDVDMSQLDKEWSDTHE